MTREELLQKIYLTKADIQTLFGVSRLAADKIFRYAMAVDDEELRFKPWPNRVRQKSVLKVQGISFKELERQIKSAPSLGGQSTIAD